MHPIDILFIAYSALLVALMPYTKVEESFNMQAVHDILFHQTNISEYDHLEFPGVVPRTFLGPLTVAAVSYPFYALSQLCNQRKYLLQYIVRLVLAALVGCSFVKFRRALSHYCSNKISHYFVFICVSQFHLAFYCSRLLPNTFALAIVLVSLAYYLEANYHHFIFTAGCAILIFRSELALLFGPLLCIILLERKLSLLDAVKCAFITLPVALSCTVVCDSYFWGRWIWPEGEVFYYNTFLNMSHRWGTMPYFWYFYSVLPRCCLASLPFALMGSVSHGWRSLRLCVSSVFFLFIYSFLPHKELRFVIYIVPVMNALAAVGLSDFCDHAQQCCRKQSSNCGWRMMRWLGGGRLIPAAAVLGHLLVNCLLTVVFASAAYHNYPGGEAMRLLHDQFGAQFSNQTVHIHICNYAAQTGTTRFLQENPHWIYNKTEGMEDAVDVLKHFDFILSETFASGVPLQRRALLQSHVIVHSFKSFAGFSARWPFLIEEDKLLLLRRHG